MSQKDCLRLFRRISLTRATFGIKHESVALDGPGISAAALSSCRLREAGRVSAEPRVQMPLPAAFLRFIGVREILGGLGLMLPGMLRIQGSLTPLAAAGLVIIIIGTVVVTIQNEGDGCRNLLVVR